MDLSAKIHVVRFLPFLVLVNVVLVSAVLAQDGSLVFQVGEQEVALDSHDIVAIDHSCQTDEACTIHITFSESASSRLTTLFRHGLGQRLQVISKRTVLVSGVEIQEPIRDRSFAISAVTQKKAQDLVTSLREK